VAAAAGAPLGHRGCGSEEAEDAEEGRRVKTIASFSGEYRFLSNFWVEGDGLTNEHRFQAAKATTEEDRAFVMAAPSPGEAKRRGRKIKCRADWDAVRIQVMLDLLRVKFQDPALAEKLLATGLAELVEGNTWGDQFWGVDGVGENHLGKLLMEVRRELRYARSPFSGVGAAPVVIAGSRSINQLRLVRWAMNRARVEHGLRVSEVVSGTAPGVDRLGEAWAAEEGIPVNPMPAAWDDLTAPGARIKVRDGREYNANAGFDRNRRMAVYAGEHGGWLVAVWDGVSPGTRDMVDRAMHDYLDPASVLLYTLEDLEQPLVRILSLKADDCSEAHYCGRAWADMPASALGNPFYNQENPGSTLPAYEEWLSTELQDRSSAAYRETLELYNRAWRDGVLTLACHCVTDLGDGSAEGRCHCAVIRKKLLRGKRVS
jgi:ribA/ribD-fused uncharacterized protein